MKIWDVSVLLSATANFFLWCSDF